MKVSDFAKKYKFKSTDSDVVNKVYGSQEKEESEWFRELQNKIDFEDVPKYKILREQKAKKSSDSKKEKDTKNKKDK